jgi:hypothetical protein
MSEQETNGHAAENAAVLPLSDQVRLAIIHAVPLPGAKPSDLGDNDKLKDDFNFGNKEYDALCVTLRQVLLNNHCDKPLPCSKVKACETVKETVELIQGIIAGI